LNNVPKAFHRELTLLIASQCKILTRGAALNNTFSMGIKNFVFWTYILGTDIGGGGGAVGDGRAETEAKVEDIIRSERYERAAELETKRSPRCSASAACEQLLG